jgi:hypothetical protein
MDRRKLNQQLQKIHGSLAALVSQQVSIGLTLADVQRKIQREFPRWCADACGIPLPDAELLIRWSTAHPDWVDPLKVDSHHPDAGELIELGTRIAARKHCIDLSEVDE